jgi:hypothetical protein
MKTKFMIGAAVFVALAAILAVACWPVTRPAPAKSVAANPQSVTSAPTPEPVTETAPVVIAQTSPAPEKTPDLIPAKKSASKKKSAAPKEPLHDPEAREALSLVGTDPEAEAYWLSAITDPSLPDQEREDLMEDLNEAGFADPKHPSADEIPLIQNRIALLGRSCPARTRSCRSISARPTRT